MNSKIIAIITARMSSSRLKGKVLLSLYGKPVLRWIADRCAMATAVNGVIIATTADPANDPIEKTLGKDYLVFRHKGDEEDVLSRVLAVAKWIDADIIVDVSGDCPCVDPRHIDFLLARLTTEQADYASNIVERTWPDGCDIQTCQTEALIKTKKLYNPERHCSWNIMQHPETFKIINWSAPLYMHYPELAITLDTVSDYELLKVIFDRFGKTPSFTVEEVVAWLKANPYLLEINKHVKRKDPTTEG